MEDPRSASSSIDRRTMLCLAGALLAGGAAAGRQVRAATETAAASGSKAGSASAGGLDARGVELFMKLHATSAEGMVPWYYTGRIYAIRERQAPLHLFNLEGTEIYWVRRVGPAEWRSTSSTLTFYRDASSGEYLDSYVNPLNDRKLALYPNVLRSRPGTFATFSARGQEGNGAVAPWMVETHRNGGVLWLTTHRASPTMPQPWMETQTIFGAERELDDPKQPNPPTTFTSSYSAPYLKWMEMGDLPGHLLWHSSGRKLAGLDELPAAYRKRADALQPQHFTAPV
ncbi:MAG: DUF1838 family protein [Steroidobacteraceae bacterium]